MAKVTFDPLNKTIDVNNGIDELFFDVDVYAEWKLWAINNLNYENAIIKVGGNTIVNGQIYISYAFILVNGWKIRPYNGTHVLTIKSNVFTYDNSDVNIPVANVVVNVEKDISGGLTNTQAIQLQQMSSQMTEVWRILGLDQMNSVLVTKDGRITTGIAQTFQNTGNGNIVITRA